MPLEFDWHPSKAQRNLSKHGISFAEAATVFSDALSLTISDPDHSEGERRFLILGQSVRGRMLVVVHCEEGDELIRIISARQANGKERRLYEQGRL